MQEYAQNSSFAIGNPCMAGNFRNDTHVLAEKEIHKNVMKNPSCRGETQITTGETRTTRETWTATFPSSPDTVRIRQYAKASTTMSVHP